MPVIGCSCVVCSSDNPRNQRLRSSVVLHVADTTLLVDSGPDLRCQALREGLSKVDGVLYTHAHLDHVAGFDELRAFCWRRDKPLPLYGTAECLDTLKVMFAWAFSPDNSHHGYIKPDPREVDGPFHYGALRITPLPVQHAAVETIGYRFDHPQMRSLAYLPDVKRIPAETLRLLQGTEVLVLDALRAKPHPTHFSITESLAAAAAIGAAETWLTHLGHENDHDDLAAVLLPGVGVAWDRLRLELGR